MALPRMAVLRNSGFGLTLTELTHPTTGSLTVTPKLLGEGYQTPLLGCA